MSAPGHCGVCGRELAVKVIVDRYSKQADTRPYCPDEDNAEHAEAKRKGWDPYSPATAAPGGGRSR